MNDGMRFAKLNDEELKTLISTEEAISSKVGDKIILLAYQEQ